MSGPPSAGDLVLVGVDGSVGTITLNRPAALNALTIPMKQELLAALRRLGRDRTIRVVVLTGAGRGFCAGQDLKERLAPDAPPLGAELRERYNPIVQAMRGLPKPIIAAVNGVAAGAGASLAFAADVRLVAESASFALAFGRIGLIPDTGATWLLPRLVGAGRAAEIVLLGEPVPAADAVRIGLAARAVPDAELGAESRALAERLAAGAPKAMALAKRALNAAWDQGLDAHLEYEAALQDLAGRTRDHAEGIAAFTEKRPSRFAGE
jgi:2-(1,2-epoxy-1,2-dihydrophenyl)acetyl-CoA isomerase